MQPAAAPFAPSAQHTQQVNVQAVQTPQHGVPSVHIPENVGQVIPVEMLYRPIGPSSPQVSSAPTQAVEAATDVLTRPHMTAVEHNPTPAPQTYAPQHVQQPVHTQIQTSYPQHVQQPTTDTITTNQFDPSTMQHVSASDSTQTQTWNGQEVHTSPSSSHTVLQQVPQQAQHQHPSGAYTTMQPQQAQQQVQQPAQPSRKEALLSMQQKRALVARTRQFGLLAPSALLNLMEAVSVMWRQTTEERMTSKEMFIWGAIMAVESKIEELKAYDAPAAQLQPLEDQLLKLKEALPFSFE